MLIIIIVGSRRFIALSSVHIAGCTGLVGAAVVLIIIIEGSRRFIAPPPLFTSLTACTRLVGAAVLIIIIVVVARRRFLL